MEDQKHQTEEPAEHTRFYQTVLTQLQRKPVLIGLVVAILLFGAGATLIAARLHKAKAPVPQQSSLPDCNGATATNCNNRQLSTAGSHGATGCKGSGPATITASPITLADLAYIQPMGLEIGGHVTPIDHGYFYIKGAFATPATIAPVYAPLDGIVTSVTRTTRNNSTNTGTFDDNAITIDATCTFRVRFSNMLKFDGGLAQKVGQLPANQSANPDYTVKAGELIGYTGMPTANGIDVWVENDQSTLTGFINPAQYVASESWKTHVVDFFDNTKEPLRDQLLALDERDAAPRFGKIDYDIDGKLVGSWFKVGTGGYAGLQKGGENYWDGHLSVVYDGNDPSQIIVSLGSYNGQPQQFAVVGNTPDPANVSQSTGLVKYELGQIETYSADTGQTWTGQAFAPHIHARAGSVQGTVLLQLAGSRSLKMEIFPNKTAGQVNGFDSNALMYER